MFLKNKKAIGPVVATALLIVVSVVAVIGFQNWFGMFSSDIFVQTETKSSSSSSTDSIETIVGDQLYIKGSKDNNLSIKKVTINGKNCNIEMNITGVQNISLRNCLENLTTNSPEVVIVTKDKIISKKIYLGNEKININSESLVENLKFIENCNHSTPLGGFNGGDGSNLNPYEICDCKQLQNISLSFDSNYSLIGNIDCSETKHWNSGKGFKPISSIDGVFNGNGFIVNNLYINRNSENLIGLFEDFYSPGVIMNVIVTGNITGANRVGGLVGSLSDGKIINSSNWGTISGNDFVGGLVGKRTSKDGIILNSYNKGSVFGINVVGGISGDTGGGNTSNCYNLGIINGSNSVGGLHGDLAVGILNNSYNAGFIYGDEYVGGLVGSLSSGFIYNSFSSGGVIANNNVGVLCGALDWGTFDNSYFNNHSNNPTSDEGLGDGVFVIQDNEFYFYNILNEPLNSWDSNLWNFKINSYPKLNWE